MLRKDELVFPPETFIARRRKLMDHIGPDSIILIPSAMPQQRNADNNHLFRQNSDFYYLTDFPEPVAIAVLIPGREAGEYILFNRAHDKRMEVFVGKYAGQDGAVAEYRANQSYDIQNFAKEITPLLDQYKNVYYPIGGCHQFYFKDDKDSFSLEECLNEYFRNRRQNFLATSIDMCTLHDPTIIIHEMRLVKEPLELAFMQQAVDISILGHMRTLQAPADEKHNEMTLSSQFVSEIMHHDTQEVSYPNIVGAGKHSCTLHYQKNDSKVQRGDVVLIDAGAEYKNYASDITRTFPISGKFTPEQRAIYELVESTQQICIDAVKPGLTILDIHHLSVKHITAGLLKLGILQGDLETLIANKAYTAYYMHGVGHWLGLDVHDCAAMSRRTTLFKPDMVMTVEPGIYIGHPDGIDPKWHNIGVRVEDDLVITETGSRVMSAALPKKADDIERVMQGWIPPGVAALGYHTRHTIFARTTQEDSAAAATHTHTPVVNTSV